MRVSIECIKIQLYILLPRWDSGFPLRSVPVSKCRGTPRSSRNEDMAEVFRAGTFLREVRYKRKKSGPGNLKKLL
jgi:hypothetical protein